MNASTSYDQVQRTELEGRELEASVLSRAARKLNRHVGAWEMRNVPSAREQFHEALAFNQRLWTFLQVEAANPAHSMPSDLRTNVLRLARYVDKTVMKLYSDGTLEDLRSLVRLNMELAQGLLAKAPVEGSADQLPETAPLSAINLSA